MHAQVDAAANTRLRALAIARELFAENGYAGTSIADIANRLGVSKAAVYYHFHAKGDLLQELIAPIVEQLQAVVCAPRPDPRALLERVVDVLEAQRSIIGMIAGDPSVAHELKERVPAPHFGALIAALAGPRASQTRQLRARCAIGAVHGALIGPFLAQKADASGATEPAPMTRHERRVVVDSALAALGE